MPYVKIAIRQLGSRFQAFVKPCTQDCRKKGALFQIVLWAWSLVARTSLGTRTKEGFRVGASGVVGGTKRGILLSPTGITAEGDRVAVEAVSDRVRRPGGKSLLKSVPISLRIQKWQIHCGT